MTVEPPNDEATVPVRRGLVYASLALSAVAVMLPSLFGPFIFDDQPLIAGNHYVHSFEHWQRWFTGGLWDTNYDPREGGPNLPYWRPMVLASYALDWAIGGGSPMGFHLTNLAVHAANAVLLLLVLRQWCRSEWAAAVGAWLFAIHPVQTETVSFIAGRTDSLCVLGMLTLVLGTRGMAAGKRGLGLLGIALGGALAFGSKESAVTLPALMFVEYWTRQEAPLSSKEVSRLLLKVLPFVGLAVALLVVRRWAVGGTPSNDSLTFSNHAQLVFEAVGRYVWMFIWPADLTLGQGTLYYAAPARYRVHWPYVALGAACVVGACWFVGRHYHRRPRGVLAVLLTCGLLLPVSGIVWLGYSVLVSPRFLYVPMVGVAFGIALLALRVGERWSFASATGAAAVFGLVLSVMSFVRAEAFSDEDLFWKAEIERNPHYPAAQEYFVVRELRQGRPSSALHLAHHFFTSNHAAGFPEVYSSGLFTRIAEALLQRTPDANRDVLTRIQRFAEPMSRGEPARLFLPGEGINWNVSKEPSVGQAMAQRRRLWLLIAAEAASRVGDDEATLKYVRQLVVDCERCWAILDSAAIARARAGDLEGAISMVRAAQRVARPGQFSSLLETLEGVRSAHAALPSKRGPLVSHYYASLGAFGRAYEAAKDAIANPPGDLPSRQALAELAVRAGRANDAVRLIGSELPNERFTQWMDELTPPLRWRDQPADSDVWIPETKPQ
jgi:hypothetical protein